MHDYSGPLREDFCWADLDKTTLAIFAREVMLCNQIHDRAIMPILAGRYGMSAMTSVAIDEWMGASPIYNARNRRLHHIEGDGVEVIMKGFQLDIGAPHMWLKFHYDVRSHDQGFFWLTSCGAYNHVRAITDADHASETQICVHMEDPTFDATVMAVNSGARCVPVYRPPHTKGELPADGPCRWEVRIEDRIGLVERNEVTDLVQASRAADFEFSPEGALDDGLADYSGPFKRDFCTEDLSSGMLLAQVKEFAMDVHLLQRASYLSIFRSFGDEAVMELIAEQWAAMAPVYQARLRRLFDIKGDGIESILKLLQLDHHFVPDYLITGVKVLDEQRGLFWIAPSSGVADGEHSGLLTGLWRGEVTGLQQAVAAANPRAEVSVANAQDWGIDAQHCYLISIDPAAEPSQPSPISELVGMNGLLEVDLSQHIYEYKD